MRRHGLGPGGRDVRGTTLLEVVVGLTVVFVSVALVGLGLSTGNRVTRELREHELVQFQAQAFIDYLRAQPFGMTSDPHPNQIQLDEIFDNDAEPGNVTLQQLTRWPAQEGGWVFQLAGFAVDGDWRVQVDADIDDDGTVFGAVEASGKILRIRVFFNEALVLATNRATESS